MRSPNKFAMSIGMVAASYSLLGCKTKEETSKTPPTASETSAPQTLTTAPPKDPLPPSAAVVYDAAGPVTLGAEAVTLLDSSGGTEVWWKVADATLRFRAAFGPKSSTAPLGLATVYATVADGEESEVFSCKDLMTSISLRVEVLARGRNVHIRCIRPPDAEDKGATEAARLTFVPTRAALVESGTYGGEGSIDPDSLDLDEGHRGDEDE